MDEGRSHQYYKVADVIIFCRFFTIDMFWQLALVLWKKYALEPLGKRLSDDMQLQIAMLRNQQNHLPKEILARVLQHLCKLSFYLFSKCFL